MTGYTDAIYRTEILDFIQVVRKSFPNSVETYSEGSCLGFAFILLNQYPGGKILWDEDHAIFEFGNECYDINGVAKKTKNHIPLEEYGLLHIYRLLKP